MNECYLLKLAVLRANYKQLVTRSLIDSFGVIVDFTVNRLSLGNERISIFFVILAGPAMSTLQASKAVEMVTGCLLELAMIRATNDNFCDAINVLHSRIIIALAMRALCLGYKFMFR